MAVIELRPEMTEAECISIQNTNNQALELYRATLDPTTGLVLQDPASRGKPGGVATLDPTTGRPAQKSTPDDIGALAKIISTISGNTKSASFADKVIVRVGDKDGTDLLSGLGNKGPLIIHFAYDLGDPANAGFLMTAGVMNGDQYSNYFTIKQLGTLAISATNSYGTIAIGGYGSGRETFIQQVVLAIPRSAFWEM